MKINSLTKITTTAIVIVSLACACNKSNSNKEISVNAGTITDPAETELWEPVPGIVKTGDAGSAPSDAIVLFNGTSMDEWVIDTAKTKWVVNDGIVTIRASAEKKETPTSIHTKQKFGDMQLHVEWMSPSEIDSSGQRRGNSGIIIQGRYELQVLDSYNNPTYVNGQAASIYKQHIPLVNACRAPGEWQYYDVIYKAPRFSESGELLSPAYITVLHNGVLVQNHVEIQGGVKHVGLPSYKPHGPKEPLHLQDHGNAVSYRNIWVREL